MIKNSSSNGAFIRQLSWLFIALVPLYYSAYMEREQKAASFESEVLDAATEEEIIRDYFQFPSNEVMYTQASFNENIDASSSAKDSSLETLKGQPAIVGQVRQEINNFLKEQGENSENLKSLACNAYACLFFERTYQRILGSHIKLLEHLEFHLGRFVSEEDVYKIFKKNVPIAQRTQAFFVKWLKFLERSHFVRVQEGKICLTNVGVEFLGYIKDRGYSLSRPG